MIRDAQILAAFHDKPVSVGDVAHHTQPEGKNRRRQGRVVIATLNRSDGDTGVHTHTRALVGGLKAADITCELVSPFSKSPWWLPVFAARRLFHDLSPEVSLHWYRRWHAAALRGNLRRELEQRRATAIIAQCPVSAAAALEVRTRLQLDLPVAMVCHFNYSEATEYRDRGELLDDANFNAMLDFERKVLSDVDHVIYVSGWAKRIVETERKIAVRESSVVWNGISDSRDVSTLTRASLGFEADDLVLMNVGTLERRKNQLGLLDLFVELLKACPRARLALVGDGPDRRDIERRVAELGMESKVRLLGHRRDVPALLATSDLYIHFAALENCPVVLIEAARAGLPVAAVPSGGVPELLAALNGVSIDPADLVGSVNTLQELLSNNDRRLAAGAASRAAFQASFTRQAMVASYLAALRIRAANPMGAA